MKVVKTVEIVSTIRANRKTGSGENVSCEGVVVGGVGGGNNVLLNCPQPKREREEELSIIMARKRK